MFGYRLMFMVLLLSSLVVFQGEFPQEKSCDQMEHSDWSIPTDQVKLVGGC